MPWLKSLQNGIKVEGMRYRPIHARVLKVRGKKTWVQLTMNEGKNRELRKILGHMRLHVLELHRIQYGPYVLGDLPPGAVREVKLHKEIRDLLVPASRGMELVRSKISKTKHKKPMHTPKSQTNMVPRAEAPS